MPDTLKSPGLSADTFYINGTDLGQTWPAGYEPARERRQWFFNAASGKVIRHGPYLGDGSIQYPDVITSHRWSLPWGELDDADETLLEFIRKLEQKQGPHTFVDWRREFLYYTAKVGQKNFYRLRKNAPTALTPNKDTDQFTLTFKVETAPGSGVFQPRTVKYKDTLSISDVVPEGEVWVHKTGLLMRTEPGIVSAGTGIEVESYPMYSVHIDLVEAKVPVSNNEELVLNMIESLEI